MTSKKLVIACGLLASVAAMPALAQDGGDGYVRASLARTKLVDKGEIKVNGTVDPAAGYETRASLHSAVTAGYFPIDHFAIEGSVSTPATTDNIPAGSLAGTPNLGDDEFLLATLGATFHPLRGPARPYVGGGFAMQFTTQQRDALAVGLDIRSTSGPYVNAGVAVDISPRFELFADVRKSWYRTVATGQLPLDASYTQFAAIEADAKLDPLTVQLGIGVRLGGYDATGGRSSDPRGPDAANWLVKVGVTNLELADKVDLNVGGAPYPGAGLSTHEHQTLSLQIARFVLPSVAINATLGVPPTIEVHGAGSIGALPTLGKVTYGPTALTVQFHPLRRGVFRPYVGVGGSYMIVFGTKDGAFSNLEVDNDLALAFEAGTEIMVNRNMGLFLDVKKALLRPETRGSFAGMNVVGQTRLDPWASTGGVSFHF